WIAWMRRLALGSPGTMAGPLVPPSIIMARVSRRRSPLCLSGPWHSKQRAARRGRTDFSKNSAWAGVACLDWAGAAGRRARGTAARGGAAGRLAVGARGGGGGGGRRRHGPRAGGGGSHPVPRPAAGGGGGQPPTRTITPGPPTAPPHKPSKVVTQTSPAPKPL